MTVSLLPLALVVAFGSALTLRLILGPGGGPEAQPAPVSRSEMNRDIERRLDLAVNGPSAACDLAPGRFSTPHAAPLVRPSQPCPSPERWREKP